MMNKYHHVGKLLILKSSITMTQVLFYLIIKCSKTFLQVSSIIGFSDRLMSEKRDHPMDVYVPINLCLFNEGILNVN